MGKPVRVQISPRAPLKSPRRGRSPARALRLRALAGLLLIAGPRVALAGLIPGLPAPLPPGREGRLNLGIENDFLGRGGEFDDHRTVQLSLDLRIGEHWLVVVDQSLLTEEGPTRDVPDPGLEGRLDEWSLTLARRWQGTAGRLMLGAGLRGTGERNGEQIQNGFHRMFGARIVALPYLPGQTDAIGWLALDREWTRALGDRWRGGTWLSAAGEVMSGGRSDANVGGFGLLRTRALELRVGLRNEWREGAYDDVVRSSTAASERGLFATFGLGLGSVDLETSQRLDGRAAYGRVTLKAGPGAPRAPEPPGRFALVSGLRLPRTAAQVDVAWTPPGANRTERGAARTSLTLGYLSGETPESASLDVFRSERQLTGGLEWQGAQQAGWVTPLVDLGLGWRREALYGMLAREGTRSDAVDRAVITAGTGLQMPMGALTGLGSLSLRLSVDGWLPLGAATVGFAGGSHRLQAPGAGLTLAVGLAFRS
jgi:hypothetical protein